MDFRGPSSATDAAISGERKDYQQLPHISGNLHLRRGSGRCHDSWCAGYPCALHVDRVCRCIDEYDPEFESTVVPDPFYPENASYVTIPRHFIAEFLRNCSRRGLKVLLDLHSMPSGAAEGAYNGIDPLKPVFWFNNSRIGNTSIALTDAGLLIVEKFIDWVEHLDRRARAGIGGLSFMNEPGQQVKDIKLKPILDWTTKAANMFRTSTLPNRGVKLYVNMIQLPQEQNFYNELSTWWINTFSEAERDLWVVMDIHNYLAWRNGCKGHHEGAPDKGYTCDEPIEQAQATVKECLEPFMRWLAGFFPGLKASGEFSLLTDHTEKNACTNPELLKMFLAQQVDAFRKSGFEPFFWTWKTPYAPGKEPWWSYQYHLGLKRPPPFECTLPTTLLQNATWPNGNGNAKILAKR